MSGLHQQEQFSSVKGITEQPRSLRGGSQERRPDCGTCSAHHIPASAPCLFGDGSIVCPITGVSITRAGKSLVKTSTVLKVIFNHLLGHSACTRETFLCCTLTHLRSSVRAYCKNFRASNFANLHGFAKFTKITPRGNLYVYGRKYNAGDVHV